MDGSFFLRSGTPDERPDRLGRVAVVIADRVPTRWMRPNERSVHEERVLAVLLQPLDHRLLHEVRLGELDREAGRSPRRTMGVCTWESFNWLVQLVRVGRDIEPLRCEPAAPRRASLFPRIFEQGTESGQNPLVAEQSGITRRDCARVDRRVRVPEEHRVVTRLAGEQRHVREPRVQRGAVENGAVAMLVRARVEARPRWSARSRVGPMVGEEDTAARQGVQGRRLDDGMAEGGEAVPAPLVERDEEDVAGRRHPTTLADVTHP